MCRYEMHIHRPEDETVTWLGSHSKRVTSATNVDYFRLYYRASSTPLPLSDVDCAAEIELDCSAAQVTF